MLLNSASPKLPVSGSVLFLAAIGILLLFPALPVTTNGTAFGEGAADPQVSLVWDGVSVRQAVRSLQTNSGVCVFLDRRVDPDQAVDFVARLQPASAALLEFASTRKLGVARIDNVFYIGPPGTCDRLATLHLLRGNEAKKLTPSQRLQWSHRAAVAWPEFSEPRDIAERLAAQFEFSIRDTPRIPHDVWAATQLPDVTPVSALLLVLAGFDLTFEWGKQGEARVVSMPSEVTVAQAYPSKKISADLLRILRAELPEHAVDVRGRNVIVDGPFSVHQRIDAILHQRDKPASRQNPDLQRYTLRVRNQPLAKLIPVLAQQFGLNVRWEIADAEQSQLISFEAKQATRDEVLQAALEPVHLRAEIDDQQQLLVVLHDSASAATSDRPE